MKKQYKFVTTLLILAVLLLCQSPQIVLATSLPDSEMTALYFYPNWVGGCGNPTSTSQAGSNPTIVIDPGHSGTDIHDTDPQTGLYDHDYPNVPEITEVFSVAQEVQAKLQTDGYTVVMTKTSVDQSVSFRQRADIADQANADLAISIHDSHDTSWTNMGGGDGGQVYTQNVNDYRKNKPNMGSGNQKVIFTDSTIAAKSNQYGAIFATERTADEHHKVEITHDSFDSRSDLPSGNITEVQLFAKVPWVYNEVGAPAGPLSQSQLDEYAKGLIDGVEKSVPITNTSPTANGGATGGSAIDQAKTFASEPITSTWNISDSTVEQWFLKQAGAQATVTKYHLNSSNIGQITSTVKAASVSPVFFYLYTVNEGGGAGGFINHFPHAHDTGNSVTDAKNDAEYLASQSKDKSAGPATGGGEPSDMPTAEARQILSSLSLGSIGVVYIQATSAVTAELEDLSGKTGDWSGLFGKPLSDAMQNIKTMGGDPLQGGSPISPSTGNCSTSGVRAQVYKRLLVLPYS